MVHYLLLHLVAEFASLYLYLKLFLALIVWKQIKIFPRTSGVPLQVGQHERSVWQFDPTGLQTVII